MIPNAPSSMVDWAGEQYKPGNSLRAWRDFLSNAHIHGLDVAPDTQFSDEPRITTHYCDSTNPQHAAAVLENIAIHPDLVIDDGLHSDHAQIATLRNFFPALRHGGLYVVEDVSDECIDNVVEAVKSIDPNCDWFVSWKTYVAIVIRKAPER